MREDEVCEPELQGQIGFKKKKEHSSQTPNWSKGRDSRQECIRELATLGGLFKTAKTKQIGDL